MLQALSESAFIDIYNSLGDKLRKLDNLRRRGGDWAKDWARRSGPEYDRLDECRKSCLNLVYSFYDFCHSSRRSEEAIRTACDKFGAERVHNILSLCLPMDRANCLYHMTLPGETPGMHWISKKDLESEDYRWLKEGYRGFGSINKRYQWLAETFNLEDDAIVQEWLKPIVIRKFIALEHRENIIDLDNFNNAIFGGLE